MIVMCSKCGSRFESLIVLREKAIVEISKLITNHWNIKHKQEMFALAEGIMKAQMAFTWYLTIGSLAFIPSDEIVLIEEKEKALDLTMNALGYDDSEDEEEEDDNKEDDDDDESSDRELEPDHLETDAKGGVKGPSPSTESKVGAIVDPLAVT